MKNGRSKSLPLIMLSGQFDRFGVPAQTLTGNLRLRRALRYTVTPREHVKNIKF
mgnify:CR=1 FL=1